MELPEALKEAFALIDAETRACIARIPEHWPEDRRQREAALLCQQNRQEKEPLVRQLVKIARMQPMAPIFVPTPPT